MDPSLDAKGAVAVSFGKKPFDWMTDTQWQMLLVRDWNKSTHLVYCWDPCLSPGDLQSFEYLKPVREATQHGFFKFPDGASFQLKALLKVPPFLPRLQLKQDTLILDCQPPHITDGGISFWMDSRGS